MILMNLEEYIPLIYNIGQWELWIKFKKEEINKEIKYPIDSLISFEIVNDQKIILSKECESINFGNIYCQCRGCKKVFSSKKEK